MRDTDERLREILRKAGPVRERRKLRRQILADALASCVTLCLMIAVFRVLPRLNTADAAGGAGHYGSLLIAPPGLGLVIIGLLSFALGVCVTLLCIHRKKLKEQGKE